MRCACVLFILISMAGSVFSYNNDHGPFPSDSAPQMIPLTELSRVDASKELGEESYKLIFTDPSNPTFPQLVVSGGGDLGWVAEVFFSGRTNFQSQVFSEFGSPACLSASSAYLNEDKIIDFVIYAFSGGCGLNCGACDVAFVLSEGDQYSITTVTSLFPDEGDFILINSKPYFVHTEFKYGANYGTCTDGKNHNFWVYNLLSIDGNKMKLDNDAHPEFPKIIWYSFKPNHAETTLLSDEQKEAIIKSVGSRIL